jgi:hypothetical protein
MPKRGQRQKEKLPRQPPAPPPRCLVWVFLAVYLGLAGSYWALIPVGLAPDESAHLKYVQWLAEHRSFPVLETGAERARQDAGYEAHQPPLYYLLAAPGYLACRSRPELAPYVPRALNILLSLIVIAAVYRFVRELLPTQPWVGVGAAALLAFVPMHLALSASITNDILAEAFFALTLWLLARHLRREAAGQADRGPALIGLCCGLGLLTKSLCLLLLPLAWAGLALASHRGAVFCARAALRKLAVVTALALLLGGPWLLRNQVRYGDPLAASAFMQAFAGAPTPETIMENPKAPLDPFAYVLMVVYWTYASAWGVFLREAGPLGGGRYIFLPGWVYVALGVVALASLGGFVRWLLRARFEPWQRRTLLTAALLAILVLAAFVHFNLRFFQAQGRYLFPALPVAALCLVIGFRSLFSVDRDSPLALLPAAGLAIVSLLALPLWILPRL